MPIPPDVAENLTAEVLKAKATLDETIAEAEKKFWLRIGELSQSYRGAQKDIAAALSVQRDSVYKNVRKYSGTDS
ncbi:hypothetical protein ACFYNM_21645 [Streptomyces spororaveus]|uniref:hypothetical protein n=1 Tax=Streptomyces spororaveus TaxID=284039 RepID=UPI0036D1EF5E